MAILKHIIQTEANKVMHSGGWCSACTGSHRKTQGAVYSIMLAGVDATGLGPHQTTFFFSSFQNGLLETWVTVTAELDIAHILGMS